MKDIRAARAERELADSAFYPTFNLEAGPDYTDRGGSSDRWIYSFDVLRHRASEHCQQRGRPGRTESRFGAHPPVAAGDVQLHRRPQTGYREHLDQLSRPPRSSTSTTPRPLNTTNTPAPPIWSSSRSASAACWTCWTRKASCTIHPRRRKLRAAISWWAHTDCARLPAICCRRCP